jgi:hypothetical protein
MEKLQLWLGQDRTRGKPGRFVIKRVIYAADRQIIPVLS